MRPDDRRYRRLLRLLPRSFREEHERELLGVWRDEADDARPIDRDRVWRAALKDTLRTAPREHATAWGRDIRHALRGFRKSPVFAVAAVMTLALGTGAAGAVFSLVNTVVLRPLPWRAPHRVGLIWAVPPRGERTWLSFPELDDLSRDSVTFESVVGLTDVRFALTTAESAEEVQALAVSHHLLSTLGVTTQAGRDFTAEDDRVGAGPVAILSHDLWRARFGGALSVVGQPIALDGVSYRVVGVLPAEFEILPASSVLPDRPDLLVPLEPHLASRDRSVRYLHALARLRDGATFAQADTALAAYIARAGQEFPRAYPSGAWSLSITSFQDDVLAGVRTPLLVTFGLVLLVLLMACTNVANLMLARGETRRGELSVKAALGAGPGRLAGELMAEALVLAIAGCGLGLALAAVAPNAIRALDPSALPRLDRLAIDWRVTAFMSALVLITAAIFTVAPMSERLRLRTALISAASRSGVRPLRAARVSGGLVVVQTMLATMVVVTTVFLVKTVVQLQHVDLGFEPRHVFSARLTRPSQQAALPAAAFFDRVIGAAAQMPGIAAAGAVTQLPLSGAMLGSTFLLEPGEAARRVDADLRGVTPGYFPAVGIRLVAGRLFDDHDLASSRPVAIVDQVFARTLQSDGRVVGRFIRWIRQPDVEVQIVGVVDGVRHRAVGEPPRETVYRPHSQYSRASMYAVVRAIDGDQAARDALAAAVASIDRHQPLADMATLDERVRRATARARATLTLAAVLAGLGLMLAAVGLCGVLSFGVSQRLREFGVRLALGATPLAVASVVLKEGVRLSLAGVALGLLAAAVVVRSVGAILYGTGAGDLMQYAVAAGVVLIASAVAFWLPARRAAAADPLTILRAE